MLKHLKIILFFIFLSVNFATPVYAIDITLQWTPNSEPNLAGYRVFLREESEHYNYLDPYWETIDPICTIYDLDETKTYYFVVRAFDTNGLESANSNEVLLIEGVPENNPPLASSSSGESDGGGGGCFIATAAYGSLMEPQVKVLRDFRDKILLNNSFGKGFVQAYYRYSPPIADFISKHDNLRAIVRLSLLPVVGISWIALEIGSVLTVALMFFFISCFIGIVWFKRRYNE
jgi:hypothetical protein